MTNWEKYFGTPELAALTTVEPHADRQRGQWIAVYHRGELVANVKARYYGIWLESEADHER